MAKDYNLKIDQGADWYLDIDYKDSNEDPIDLSGYIAKMQFREETQSTNAPVTLQSLKATITAINVSSGFATYTASNSFTVGQNVNIRNVVPVEYNLDNAVITSANSTSFSVIDTESLLFATYSKTTLEEASANDGTITSTLTITLNNETFKGADGANLSARVTNVPAGLTASLIRTNSRVATLSFTGSATAHANANDVTNLTITFLNADINGGSVTAVRGLNTNSLQLNFANPDGTGAYVAPTSTLPPAIAYADSGISIVPETGHLSIHATAAQTTLLTARQYQYDLKIISTDGIVTRLIQGVAAIDDQVTRV